MPAAALPDGAYGVDDIACGKPEPFGNDRLAGRAVADGAAGAFQLVIARRRENRAADTAAGRKAAVGRVDNGVGWDGRDIVPDEC